MTAIVHHLHPVPSVGHYLRLGHTGHRKLEDLHASGRFAIDRVVVDAAHINEQTELLDSLRTSDTEIVLDPQVAELSTPGGFLTSARKLPWADSRGPYASDNFDRSRIIDMAAKIADFAIEHRVHAVLCPTHLLNGPQDAWLAVDAEMCQMLRASLDARGANIVAIDFPLLTTYQVLLDGAARSALATHISDLPFEYLWLRIDNFGSDKSAAGFRKYINAARDFHEIGKPIIADAIGGLPSLGIVAFGATGGICHGVAEKERFYPHHWSKPRAKGAGGGSKKRVYFSGLDAYLNDEQARTLLTTRNAKPLLGCSDMGCCPGGWEDMILNHTTHYLTQTTRRVQELGRVPEMRRADHFLSHQLAPADRVARQALRLRVGDKKIMEKLAFNSRKTDDMRHVFEELRTTVHNLTRSSVPLKRTKRTSVASGTRGR